MSILTLQFCAPFCLIGALELRPFLDVMDHLAHSWQSYRFLCINILFVVDMNPENQRFWTEI